MEKSYVIKVLKQCLDSIHKSRKHYLFRSSFEQSSYAQWTYEEIIRRIIKSDDSPLEVIEEFIEELSESIYVNVDNSYIFSVALDTAEDIYRRLFFGTME